MTGKQREHLDEEWLQDREDAAVCDPVLQALDELYGEGPGERATAAAQNRLQAVLAHRAADIVYYDDLPESPVGALYLAVGADGIVAIDFGEDEARFLKHLRRRTKARLLRSPMHVAEAAEQLLTYLEGRRPSFDLAVDLSTLTPFQRQVLSRVMRIPRGEVMTYGELARQLGRPKAARAVGQALGKNPIPIVIPCHRVLAADGTLGGYSGREGVKTKASLLRLEGALP